MSRVAIVAAKRTPIGGFQGKLSGLTAPQLGSVPLRACLEHVSMKPELLDEVRLGNVLGAGLGQAPTKQASLGAGIPTSVPCTTVGKVCGSGMRAMMDLWNSVVVGEKDIVMGGGMESMSNAPYLLPGARAGYRMGPKTAVDCMIHDGLWDPYNDMHMGNCGEICAEQYGITREEQDAYAKVSLLRAQEAVASGTFKDELASVVINKGTKKEAIVDMDEGPGQLNADKIPSLRPAFKKDGTVTAANAAGIGDGAAAILMVSEAKVKELGLTPLAWMTGHATHSQEPVWFTTAPCFASRKVLDKLSLKPSDIDLWEINEAFALVTMVTMRDLNLSHDVVNVNGGSCALGHPIGATGARIMVSLIHQLHRYEKKRGLATLCLGGGEATAVVLERPE